MMGERLSHACTTSTARTTMLRNGLRHVRVEPGLAGRLARRPA